MGVAIGANAAARRNRCALRIRNALVVVACRVFTANRNLYCGVCVNLPDVGQLQVRYVACHELRIRETGTLVAGCILCKCAGLGDSFAQCAIAEIGCTGAPFLRIVVDSNANTAIIRIFEIFDIPQSGGRAQPIIVTRSSLGLICALSSGFIQYELNNVFKVRLIQ